MAVTICSYHLALASIFKYSGCYVFDSPEIAAILKNFALERPLRLQEISHWSLSMVLSFLEGAPFEPLKEASMEDLTRMTILLIVLASGRCFSEVQIVLGLLSW